MRHRKKRTDFKGSRPRLPTYTMRSSNKKQMAAARRLDYCNTGSHHASQI